MRRTWNDLAASIFRPPPDVSHMLQVVSLTGWTYMCRWEPKFKRKRRAALYAANQETDLFVKHA